MPMKMGLWEIELRGWTSKCILTRWDCRSPIYERRLCWFLDISGMDRTLVGCCIAKKQTPFFSLSVNKLEGIQELGAGEAKPNSARQIQFLAPLW